MDVDPLEEELDQQIIQLDGVEQIGSAETSDQWTIWRRNLAVSMFHEWRASRQAG